MVTYKLENILRYASFWIIRYFIRERIDSHFNVDFVPQIWQNIEEKEAYRVFLSVTLVHYIWRDETFDFQSQYFKT